MKKIIMMSLIIGSFLMNDNMQAQSPQSVSASDINLNRAIKVRYQNWRGQLAVRTIVPLEIFWGKTEWHPHEQWILRVWDVERQDYREYAFADIKEIGL